MNLSHDCSGLFLAKLFDQPLFSGAGALASIAAAYPMTEGDDVGWDSAGAIRAGQCDPMIHGGLVEDAYQRATTGGATAVEVVKGELPIGGRVVVGQTEFERLAASGVDAKYIRIVLAVIALNRAYLIGVSACPSLRSFGAVCGILRRLFRIVAPAFVLSQVADRLALFAHRIEAGRVTIIRTKVLQRSGLVLFADAATTLTGKAHGFFVGVAFSESLAKFHLPTAATLATAGIQTIAKAFAGLKILSGGREFLFTQVTLPKGCGRIEAHRNLPFCVRPGAFTRRCPVFLLDFSPVSIPQMGGAA